MTSQNTEAHSLTSIVQVGSLPPRVEADLRQEFTVVRLPDSGVDDFLAEHGGRFSLAVTTGMTGVSGPLMRRLPALRAVINFGVGYDTTDVETARELGIVVSNTPDVLTDCVADLAVGLLIDVARGITSSDRFVRRGDWLDGAYPLGTRVSDKRVGIVGLGRIGRAIAHRLEAFGVTVGYHGRTRADSVDYNWYESLVDLADESDFLIVAVSGGPDTAGLISRDVLDALGPKGYLINVARGSVVDEGALVDALRNRTIAGAALDVFVEEPHVPEALFGLDNVVLVPHLGSATAETRQDMADLFMTNVRKFVSEGALATPVP